MLFLARARQFSGAKLATEVRKTCAKDITSHPREQAKCDDRLRTSYENTCPDCPGLYGRIFTIYVSLSVCLCGLPVSTGAGVVSSDTQTGS